MRHSLGSVLVFVAVVTAGAAGAQTALSGAPSPENSAAAHQLIQVMRATDQFKAVLPIIEQNLKKAIVQDRPEVEKQYDAMMPVFTQKVQDRVGQMTDTIADIYARNFTLKELQDLIAFYQSPTGQKFLEKQPAIVQATMAAGSAFGQSVVNDIQQQMGEHQQ